MQPPVVTRVDPRDTAAMLGLAVRPEQRAWVGAIADTLADLAGCPDSDSMAVWHGRTAVGHYRIDPHARSIAGHDLALPTLGLRAFFIDARWQGRGLGTAALRAMFVDLIARHPGAHQLALGVSADNHGALRLYLRSGFVDGGELYRDGRGVAQHLLLRALP